MNVTHIRMIKTKSGSGSKPEIIGERRVKIAKRNGLTSCEAIPFMPDYATLLWKKMLLFGPDIQVMKHENP